MVRVAEQPVQPGDAATVVLSPLASPAESAAIKASARAWRALGLGPNGYKRQRLAREPAAPAAAGAGAAPPADGDAAQAAAAAGCALGSAYLPAPSPGRYKVIQTPLSIFH
jgi:hypothetical protein